MTPETRKQQAVDHLVARAKAAASALGKAERVIENLQERTTTLAGDMNDDLTIVFTVLADLSPQYEFDSVEKVRIRSALRACNRIGVKARSLLCLSSQTS